MRVAALFAALAVSASFLSTPLLVLASGDHDGHDHGEKDYPWEWAAGFSLTAPETFVWTISRDGEAYAEDHLRVMIIEQKNTECKSISEEVEELAEATWETPNLFLWEIDNGETWVYDTVNTTNNIELHFDTNSFVSLHSVEFQAAGCYLMFTEHNPMELEGSAGHFLRLTDGSEAKETFIVGEELPSDNAELLAFVGVTISVLPTLIGIALIRASAKFENFQGILHVLKSFAAGALLSASLLHMYPEGVMLISDSLGEIEFFWKSGTCVIGGMALCWAIHFLVHFYAGPPAVHRTSTNHLNKLEIGDKNHHEDKPINWSLVLALFFGDGCHNLVDGVLIAAAFLTCNTAAGWSIVLVAIAHELPQELGDYVLCVEAGLSPVKALMFNISSGAFAYIGAIIVVIIQDSIGDMVLGYILLIGAGVFIHIALVELVPEQFKLTDNKDKIRSAVAFLLGIVILGLSLLAHTHCGDGHEGHDHEGHDH